MPADTGRIGPTPPPPPVPFMGVPPMDPAAQARADAAVRQWQMAQRARAALRYREAGARREGRSELAREMSARGTWDPFAFQAAMRDMERTLAMAGQEALTQSDKGQAAMLNRFEGRRADLAQDWDQTRSSLGAERDAAQARRDEWAGATERGLMGSIARNLTGGAMNLAASGALRRRASPYGGQYVYNWGGMRQPADLFDYLGAGR